MQCSSGMQAVADVAASIRADSMTLTLGQSILNYRASKKPRTASFLWVLPLKMLHTSLECQGRNKSYSCNSPGLFADEKKCCNAEGTTHPWYWYIQDFCCSRCESRRHGCRPSCCKGCLELSDMDLFEINEAFASQFVYCRNKLDQMDNKC
ncbi:hypothetical protein K1719_014087 [Acacia pycnantha]|nr:hypothetical protein K1719_014087 [Acacia pycnantha]